MEDNDKKIKEYLILVHKKYNEIKSLKEPNQQTILIKNIKIKIKINKINLVKYVLYIYMVLVHIDYKEQQY